MGLVDEYLLVGRRYQRGRRYRWDWRSQWRNSCVCDGARIAYTDTYANANCNTYRYAHRDSDSGAESYSYTKAAPQSAAATVALRTRR